MRMTFKPFWIPFFQDIFFGQTKEVLQSILPAMDEQSQEKEEFGCL